MSYYTEGVHISTIRIGDTVEIDGELKTVGKSNVKQDSFIGVTLFGDSFRSGSVQVKKVDMGKRVQKCQ